MFVDYTAIVAIICGTGMISIISVGIIRALSRRRKTKDVATFDIIMKRLDSIEAKILAQDEEVQRLGEDNRFLNRLLKHDDD
jgi:hypothetical protein